MSARRRLYVKQWDHQKPEDRYTVRVERGDKPVAGVQSSRISSVEEELMTWRKANHIHKWFVENVQDGKDDCGEYEISEYDLGELHSLCERVIEASKLVDGMVYNGTVYSKEHPNGQVQRTAGKVIEDPTVAKDLLPTCEGFFFGSTEYDEYYLDEVIRTRDWIESMSDEMEDGLLGEVYYSSSW